MIVVAFGILGGLLPRRALVPLILYLFALGFLLTNIFMMLYLSLIFVVDRAMAPLAAIGAAMRYSRGVKLKLVIFAVLCGVAAVGLGFASSMGLENMGLRTRDLSRKPSKAAIALAVSAPVWLAYASVVCMSFTHIYLRITGTGEGDSEPADGDGWEDLTGA